MSRERLIRRAAVGVAVCSLALLLGTTVVIAVPSLRDRFSRTSVSAYQSGQTVDLPTALFEATRRTLFVFSRADCAACQRSKLSTAELVVALRKQPGTQAFMVVAEGKVQDELRFAADLGLDEAHVIQTNLSLLRVEHVPTYLLVDERGRILHVIDGVLTEESRQSLVRAATTDSTSFAN